MADRRRLFALAAALSAVLTTVAPAARVETPRAQEAAQGGIIFLSSDDFTRPYLRLMFEAFSGVMQDKPDAPVIYFESADALRFQDRQYLEDFRDWLRRKYRDKHIDLVVPLGEDLVGFLAEARGEPWPTAQVLYLEAGSVRFDTRATLPQAGGMLLEDHTLAALAVIRTILPETRRVALVYGASAAEHARFSGFADKVRAGGLEPIVLAGMPIDDTRDAIARLPDQTVVLLLAPTVDANGHVLSASLACERISSAGTAPTFGLGAQDLGCGVVGGLLRDWSIVGGVLATEALARLKKASNAVVTLPIPRYTRLAFDDRQLQRWRIPERRLPPGASILFRETNLWRDHRALTLAALGVTLVQSALIAGLVFEHRRRRRAELESRRNLAALAHLDRRAAMGELATSLAHELNQPLNAILQNAGVAQMLIAANPLPPAFAEMPDIIGDIRKDDIRASEVIRRMRKLLQKHELESHPVDLNELAHETIAIVRPDARSREIHLDTELPDGIGLVLGDRVHLQQVLLNLLMNAVDAVATMPPDRRRVRVWSRQVDGQVRMAVADTGVGIPGDRIAEIFEPFYTTKSDGRGMGMGLAIARSIIEAHSGRLKAENNPGGGTTVWFSLPVSENSTKGQ